MWAPVSSNSLPRTRDAPHNSSRPGCGDPLPVSPCCWVRAVRARPLCPKLGVTHAVTLAMTLSFSFMYQPLHARQATQKHHSPGAVLALRRVAHALVRPAVWVSVCVISFVCRRAWWRAWDGLLVFLRVAVYKRGGTACGSVQRPPSPSFMHPSRILAIA